MYLQQILKHTNTQHDRHSHSKASRERKKEGGMRKQPAHKHLCPPITRIHHDQVCFGSAHYLASVNSNPKTLTSS